MNFHSVFASCRPPTTPESITSALLFSHFYTFPPLCTHTHRFRTGVQSFTRLLGFLLSSCTWKDRELTATFRQPFDMIAVAADTHRKEKAAGRSSGDLYENWLLITDSSQTLCLAPSPDDEELQQLQLAGLRPGARSKVVLPKSV